MNRSLSDLMTFGKVVSSALLICGYIVLGVILGKKLVSYGFADYFILILAFLGALIGLWQSWNWLKPLWKK